MDLRAELVESLSARYGLEIVEARSIAEDLNATRNVTEVILTRLEAHATKLEVYTDMLRDLLKGKTNA
jgi:hypothetical protein